MKRPSKETYRLLEREDQSGEQNGKVIILDGFSPAQLHAFIALYRQQTHLPQDVAFAVVTENSAKRRLGDVVEELRNEARSNSKGS